jgi:hypothetical protein
MESTNASNGEKMKIKRVIAGACVALLPYFSMAAPVDFDIHFVVMTEKLQGPGGSVGADKKTRRSEMVMERFKSHVEKLNTEFRSESGEQLVNFHLKSATLFLDAKSSQCEAVRLAAAGKSFGNQVAKCKDAAITSPKAINVYIYAPADGSDDDRITSFGGHNSNGPYAFIHWKSYHDFNKLWHELGHAFGLPHVCSSPRPEGAHWNIMATPDTCRNGAPIVAGFHFDEKQTATVKTHIEKYRKLFGKQ